MTIILMEETRLSGESHQLVIVIDKHKIAFGTPLHEGRRPRKYFLVIDCGYIYICSVSMVRVQIPSREEQKYDNSKI